MPVKVLLLPKFEISEMSGDFPGEAQYYYEHYLTGADEYDVRYNSGNHDIRLRDERASIYCFFRRLSSCRISTSSAPSWFSSPALMR